MYVHMSVLLPMVRMFSNKLDKHTPHILKLKLCTSYIRNTFKCFHFEQGKIAVGSKRSCVVRTMLMLPRLTQIYEL